MRRYLSWIRVLSSGAVTLGLFQAWQGIDFASLWTGILIALFNSLISLLFSANGAPFV